MWSKSARRQQTDRFGPGGGDTVVEPPGFPGFITVRLSQTTSFPDVHQLLLTSHHNPGAHSRRIGVPREQM